MNKEEMMGVSANSRDGPSPALCQFPHAVVRSLTIEIRVPRPGIVEVGHDVKVSWLRNRLLKGVMVSFLHMRRIRVSAAVPVG